MNENALHVSDHYIILMAFLLLEVHYHSAAHCGSEQDKHYTHSVLQATGFT